MVRPIKLLQGSVDVLILKTLSRGAMHGYGVSTWIRQRTEGILRAKRRGRRRQAAEFQLGTVDLSATQADSPQATGDQERIGKDQFRIDAKADYATQLKHLRRG